MYSTRQPAKVIRHVARYRGPSHDKAEMVIFESPDIVPEGEGWVDNAGKLPGGPYYVAPPAPPAPEPAPVELEQPDSDAKRQRKAKS